MLGPLRLHLQRDAKPPCPRLSDANSNHLSSVVWLETTQGPVHHQPSTQLRMHWRLTPRPNFTRIAAKCQLCSPAPPEYQSALLSASFIELFIYHQCGFTIHCWLYLLRCSYYPRVIQWESPDVLSTCCHFLIHSLSVLNWNLQFWPSPILPLCTSVFPTHREENPVSWYLHIFPCLVNPTVDINSSKIATPLPPQNQVSWNRLGCSAGLSLDHGPVFSFCFLFFPLRRDIIPLKYN